jgi:hypothetical protein
MEPNVNTSNFIKQTLLNFKAQIALNTTIVGDFNTPFSVIGHHKPKKNQHRNFRIK